MPRFEGGEISEILYVQHINGKFPDHVDTVSLEKGKERI